MLHVPSCLLYAVMSTGMVFANKFTLNYWQFNYPIMIITTEITLNILSIGFLSHFNYLKNIDINLIRLFRSDPHRLYIFSAGFFYALHSVSSLKALSRMNIPMYVIFKRCVPLVNLILSFFLFQKKKTVFNSKITASILLMTFGVIIAGLGDISFDANAYFYCGFSVICQALYFTSIQKCGETQKNSFQALFNSSCISWPVLMFSLSFTGEMHSVLANYDQYFTKFNFNLSLLIAVLCGSTLCFSQFYCTMNNNAVTTSVVGVLKSVVQTGVGMFVFTDFANFNMLTLLGISINLIFGTWYTYLKYIEDYHAVKDTQSTV